MGNEVFISYSRKDKNRVQTIVKQLEDQLGIECWIDLTSLETNELFVNTIKTAIDNCQILLFMYTQNSDASTFAQKEILYAEDNNKTVVLVLLEDLIKDSWCNLYFKNVHNMNINDWRQRKALYQFITNELNGKTNEPVIKCPTHRMADLGLSICWSEYNLDTNSSQNKINYFSWGDTNADNLQYDTSTLSCDMLFKNIGGTRFDIVRATWGGKWRLPTTIEVKELKDKCKWEWTVSHGEKGYKVTGPNGKHIFLPANGFRQGTVSICEQVMGCYWTDTLNNHTNLPVCLCFGNGTIQIKNYSRYLGFSIRPVCKK